MADISYEPIFTYKGLNKISKALQDSSTIQLTHLALGDAKDSLDYNVSPSAESLNNEIIRISISTVTFTDVVASNNMLMHIEGLLTPQDSPNMVIREYGIYDNEGDLLIICRYPDYHTMQTGMPITNMIFKSDIYLVNNAAAFTEDYYGSGDHTTVEEFNTHVLNYNNPHNVDHTHIPGLENLDNTSPEMKPFNQNNKDLFTDGKFATGFTNRVDSKITNTSDTINLKIIDNSSEFGSIYSGSDKWYAGALAPNGKIYCAPANSTQVLEIDPETKTTTLIGSVYNGNYKWYGTALAPNGRIYCAPRDSTQVLEIDPDTKTTTLIGSVYSGGGKWYGAALAPNGKIYCVPYNATQVLEIDPITKTTTLIGSVYSGGGKWIGAALAPNGKIYCAPNRASQVLEIDPITKTTTLVGSVYNGNYKWTGAALAPNGKIYCAPASATQVLEIDPDTKTTTLIGSNHNSGSWKWLSAALAPNGKIYCVPYNSTQILIIDPERKKTELIGNSYSGTSTWADTVLSQNGKLYGIPYSSTQVLELDLSRISIYKYGVKYNIDTDLNITVEPDSSGYIGYDIDSNSLYYIGDNPNFSTDILVAWYYSNPIDGIIWLNDERHSVTRNVEYHKLTHNTTGTIWKYGGELTTSDFTKLNIANFGIADEDLEFDISHAAVVVNDFTQVLINAKLPVLYVANGKYRRAFNNNTLNWLYNGNGAVYNDINNGRLITVADNKYLTYIVLFTPSIKEPVKLVVGIGEYDTENAAENESFESYGLSMPELVAAYRIILHKNNAYANLAKTKITKIVKIRNLNDGGKADLTNHNLFTDRFEGIQHPTSAIIGLDQALAEAGNLKDIELVGTMKSKLSIDEIAREATLTTFQSDSTNMPAIYGGGNPNGESRVLTDFIGSVYGSGNSKWKGAALAPNGKIYCVPHNVTQVLEIDPITQTTTLIGSVYSGTFKWEGATLAPNGKIYCAPYNASQVLEIDPITKTTTLIGSVYGSGGKWIGAALAPNGKIYCVPYNATQVLEIDPITKTTTLIGSVYSDISKWRGAALAPNGKIYCVPNNSTQVLEIDPSTKTTTLIGSVYSGGGEWIGAALAPNGRIYCAPRNATQVLEIDPITKTTTLIGSVYSGGGKWYGAALAPNGKIYCAPFGATQVLEIDPATKTTTLIGSVYSSAYKWMGAVLAPNGKIYCVPYGATQVLEIEVFPKSTDFQKYLLLPENIIN